MPPQSDLPLTRWVRWRLASPEDTAWAMTVRIPKRENADPDGAVWLDLETSEDGTFWIPLTNGEE